MDQRGIEYHKRLNIYKRRTAGTREDAEINTPVTAQKLPYDVLFLILLKLPNESLARFRFVSKEFEAVILDPAFVALRKCSLIIQAQCRSITRSCPPFKYFCISFPKVEEISLEMTKGMPNDPYLIGSCHELLCFLGFKGTCRIHYVYNCVTKEWISSPPINSSGKRFCVLYHKRSTGTYHLLAHVSSENRLSTRSSNGRSEVPKSSTPTPISVGGYKVHELGTTSWRAVSKKSIPYVPLPCRQSTPVAMFGCLYWICISNKQHDRLMILAFDIETEQFNYIREPPIGELPHRDSEALTLVETDVGLGYPTFTESTMNIWVMKGRNRTWVKGYVINLDPIQNSLYTSWELPDYVVMLCTKGEIWFSDHGRRGGGNYKLTIYNCISHTFRSVEFRSLFPECSSGVMNYTSCMPCLWKSATSLNAC